MSWGGGGNSHKVGCRDLERETLFDAVFKTLELSKIGVY